MLRSLRTLVPLAALLLAPSAVLAQDEQAGTIQDAQGALQEGRFDDAAEILTGITEAAPANAQAWFLLGYALHLSGDIDAAIPAHEKAAELAQGQLKSGAFYNLACAHSLKGDADACFEALGAAIAAGFNNADQLRQDGDFENVREDPRFAVALARASGESPAAAPEAPTHTGPHFWVGDWDVYNREGVQVGSNVLTEQANGRVVHESWTSARGGTGVSINYEDPNEPGRWVQVWVDKDGGMLEMGGRFEDGSLRMQGVYSFPGERPDSEHITTLTPLEGGYVRQHIQDRASGANEWTVSFDAIYVPKGEQPPAWWPDEIPE